jgi:hypothetical protein
MKIRYGSLVNVKILNVKKWTWATNLNRVYKTDMGRLFGTYVYDDLFYTSHSLDRWNERIDHDKFKYFSQFFKIRYHTSPTDLDALMFNIQMTRQIGLKRAYPNYRYLSINQGCLILEVLQGICIAKTFLSCDMAKEDKGISWFGYDKKLLTDISDCIIPSEDLKEEYDPVNEEIPVGFCAAYFKVI